MADTRPLNRETWLEANGFKIDPFEEKSFHAETDILLKDPRHECYVDRIDVKLLIGDFASPGYRFIFSMPGGGKSSLRRRIHFEYDSVQLLETKPRALVVDYINHDYLSDVADLHHHVNRIIYLVEAALKKPLNEEKLLLNQSSELALRKLVKTCKESGYAGVYVLVDNLDTHSFEKIISLARTSNRLNINGFIIKFFMPENFFFLAQSVLQFVKSPPYFLAWEEDELSQILNQRLVSCLDPTFQPTSEMKPISFLCNGDSAKTIESNLVKIGKFGKSPRLMWQLGNYLLDEHIKNNGVGRYTKDLVNYEFFAKAQLRLLDTLLVSETIIGYKLESNLDFRLKQSIKVPPRPERKINIFLSCGQEDQQFIHDRLYQELKAKNYKPWMDHYDILPGDNRDLAIRSAIKDADFFLLCLSSRSLSERGDFQKELRWARKKQEEMLPRDIFIIPLRLEDCDIPDELGDFHYEYIDWFADNQRKRLFSALKKGKYIER